MVCFITHFKPFGCRIFPLLNVKSRRCLSLTFPLNQARIHPCAFSRRAFCYMEWVGVCFQFHGRAVVPEDLPDTA